MPSNKRVARCLSLLAGSSLAAASLSAVISVGAVLAPATAQAQACTPSTATGPGDDIITCTGPWFMDDTPIDFGAGDDVLSTVAAGDDDDGGAVFTGVRLGCDNALFCVDTHQPEPDRIIDFGDGDDTFDNAGHFVINPTPSGETFGAYRQHISAFEGDTILVGLETFNNSGTVLLGGVDDPRDYQNVGGAATLSDDFTTDGWYDDVLSMPGATLVGDGGEIVFDIELGRTQTSCTDRNAQGDLGAADCLMIAGGATEGVNYVTLREIFPGDRGRYNPEGVLLVDVAGGTSAQGDFVIGPNTPGYRPEFGGVLDKGPFTYVIVYDADTQQHVLHAMPSDNAFQFAALAGAAHGLWRVSTGSWLERQADLRGDLAEGVGGGAWLRVSGEQADREVAHTATAGGLAFDWDNTSTQSSYAVTGGLDLMAGAGGGTAYVVGLMAGYAHADVEYDASPNQARLDGFTGGAYASFISGGFYLDAAVNAHRLELEDDVPTFGLFPAGTILATDVVSVGGQVEAGWRIPLAEGVFVEPLASVSYVRTRYDDMHVPSDDTTRPGVDVEFDDPASFRAGVGGRLGLDQDYGPVRAQFSVLGRVWNEFEGESRVFLHNAGPTVTAMDDFSGQFSELSLGASIYGMGGAVSGFANLGGKFGDDYSATTASIGVRVAW